MKKLILFFILTGFLFHRVSFAGELHGPHTHGEMELLALWEDKLLQISILASAQDLVGYERDPRSAREKKALRNFDEKYDPFVMFGISHEYNCEFMRGSSESDMFSAVPHKHGLLEKTHVHDTGLEGHIDFYMHYIYECASAPEIRLELFDLMPSIKKVNVRKVVIDGEISNTLTKDNNLLRVE